MREKERKRMKKKKNGFPRQECRSGYPWLPLVEAVTGPGSLIFPDVACLWCMADRLWRVINPQRFGNSCQASKLKWDYTWVIRRRWRTSGFGDIATLFWACLGGVSGAPTGGPSCKRPDNCGKNGANGRVEPSCFCWLASSQRHYSLPPRSRLF